MSLRTLLSCLALGLALTACSEVPLVSAPAGQHAAPPAEPRAAVAYYDALADDARTPAREAYQLDAASAALASGDAEAARRRLAAIDVAPLDDTLILRKQALSAQVALAQGRAADAVRALEIADQLRVPPAQRADALALRAAARAASGDLTGSARDRAQAAPQLTDPAARAANQTALLEILQRLDPHLLQAELAHAGAGLYGSWLELGLALQAPVPAERARRLAHWRARYPQHPAARELSALPAPVPGPLPGAVPGTPLAPVEGQIAVLLPLSAQLRTAGEALADGILAAHYAAGGRRPLLRFYDTGAGDDVAKLYADAVAGGARAVIGPLSKQAVGALAATAALPVPTLALNNPEPAAHAANLYVLSLDPADEIAAAQDQAWAAGLRRAAVLYPDDAWGARLFELMRDHWVARGGTVTAAQGYDPHARDYSDVVRRLLDLAGGQERHRRLERVLGTPVVFQPGPRADTDVVLLAATSPQARLIQPQLRYFGAGMLPVYATAQVWGGAAVAADRDLEGIGFCDTPWTLTPQAAPHSQARLTVLEHGLPRLYALGMDAYNALRQLPQLAGEGAALAGVSGTLRLDEGGRLRRELPCAQFRDGGVVLLPTVQAALP